MERENGALLPKGYEEYVRLFEALSHPMRIKIIGILAEERQYVSELARMINISRPLLYMHLKKLEAAGLVTGHHEISASGKAIKYYECNPFDYHLNMQLIEELAAAIPAAENDEV